MSINNFNNALKDENNNNHIYCNNCGKIGHNYNKCHTPITSLGIILMRYNNINGERIREYLMIRRKDSLGYVDFLRGKYQLYNLNYLQNIIDEMTIIEKYNILEEDYQKLWYNLWGSDSRFQYKNEEKVAIEKLNILKKGITLNDKLITVKNLIIESKTRWNDPEWGFPKGRREYKEKDILCAIREFNEETGINKDDISIIENIIPIEEIFTGSNYKSYKHKYYIAYLDNNKEIKLEKDDSEVSCIEWKSYEDCLKCIRPYNLERIEVIKKIDNIFNNYKLIY
jgi:8-oxo-dGTP pyrophosphatase MutT (NUDIX family)